MKIMSKLNLERQKNNFNKFAHFNVSIIFFKLNYDHKITISIKDNENGLYLVSTPIGNLKDITLRAIETLKKSSYILCEDTRVSKNLLDRYEIKSQINFKS